MPVPGGPKIGTEEIVAAAFGASAAVLLVGSSFFLRWQRNRQRFELTRLAMENGATNFPKGPPHWLVSLREAVTTIALGIGLLIAGGASYWIGVHTPLPTNEELKEVAKIISGGQQGQGRAERRTPPMQRRGPEFGGEEGFPPPPEEMGRPQDQQQQRPPPREDTPPMPVPALEKYKRGQTMQTIGELALGAGAVLTVLGLIRAGFTRIERKHEPGID